MNLFNEQKNLKLFLESLFKKRKLDNWYKETIQKPFISLNEFENLFNKNVTVNDFGVYVEMHFDLKIFQNEDFKYEENLIVQISKILPFYCCKTLCKAQYSKFDHEIQAENVMGTFELNNLIGEIEEILHKLKYKKLEEDELYETVFEWDELKHEDVETFGTKKLTLEYASFFDVLNLIEE